MRMLSAAAAVALAVSAVASHAVATYNFRYADSSGTLRGQLTGTLQADNNTVIVNSIVDFASWNAVSGPSLPFIDTYTAFALSFPPALGIVSLDGSAMDIVACTSSACIDGFFFQTSGLGFGAPVYGSGSGFGNNIGAYVSRNWSLSAAGVPEPASWALMITGFGLVGSAQRLAMRRRVAVTA